MRQNMQRVIEAFKAGTAAVGDSKRTCWTDGTTVYSYAMPIAKRSANGSIAIVRYEDAPTNTTRSQVRALVAAFSTYRPSDIGRGVWTANHSIVPVSTLAPTYRFHSLAGESGYQDKKPAKRAELAERLPADHTPNVDCDACGGMFCTRSNPHAGKARR